MKTPTIASRCVPVSLLLITGLASAAVCAGVSHAHRGPHGASGHVHVARAGGYDAGGSHHAGHHGGMHDMQHGGGRHAMPHASNHGHSYAKGHGGHGRGTHSGDHQSAAHFIEHMLQFKDGMSLTDEQVRQLHALKTTYKKARITMKADIKLANVDLHDALKDEQSSLADIEAHLNAIHAVKTKLYLASIKAKREAKALLSDEQRSRMQAIHDRITSHGGGMMHQGGHDAGHDDHKAYKRK